MHMTEWYLRNIPTNNSKFDGETWRDIIIKTRIECERRAEELRLANRPLTEEEQVRLSVVWCCGDLPHPPVYYFPEKQAFDLADSLGVPRDWIDRP